MVETMVETMELKPTTSCFKPTRVHAEVDDDACGLW